MHTLAVTDAPSHNLWSWGWGSCGQLGIGTKADSTTPTLVAGAWRARGRRAAMAAAGQMHSCAILDDNTLWTWGGTCLPCLAWRGALS